MRFFCERQVPLCRNACFPARGSLPFPLSSHGHLLTGARASSLRGICIVNVCLLSKFEELPRLDYSYGLILSRPRGLEARAPFRECEVPLCRNACFPARGSLPSHYHPMGIS